MADYNDDWSAALNEERIELAAERIRQIPEESGMPLPFRDFFHKAAGFLGLVLDLRTAVRDGSLRNKTMEELKAVQAELYSDMLPEQYGNSWLNPQYAAAQAGEERGRILSALYAELYALLRFVYENKDEDIAPVLEIFLQIHGMFGEEAPSAESLKDAFFWYASDYLDMTVPERNRELLIPSEDPETDLYHGFAADDLRYLFFSGDYISDETITLADTLNHLPEEESLLAAKTFAGGYIEGFRVMGKDIRKKKSVVIRYLRGFERFVLLAAEEFLKAGLKVILPGAAVRIADRIPGSTERQLSGSPNRQFDYDHRFDAAIFWDKAFTDRKISELRLSYTELKKEAAEYGGPAVIEYFGERSFSPENHPEILTLSPKQKKLLGKYKTELSLLRNEFMPGEETAFTIISWPLPEIGSFYPELFRDILKVNTLDNDTWREMQQIIIDVLDRADHVEVTGCGKNETALRIALKELKEPEKETRFENCTADVNIPVGEVFTSPVLKGTDGLLHVSAVYIDGLLFRDLRIRFENGRTAEVSCANFEAEEENAAFVRENIMGSHEILPMGEFAIGTNTPALRIARKYDIEEKMPILIAEKTGPHFALGDTCYSYEEDVMTYNPDGKAIIARDNEISALRTEAPEKAYFGWHKDITIPYEEIGSLTAVMPDGTREDIIRSGRFALRGLEALNRALDE